LHVRRLVLVKHSLPKIVPEVPRREWQLSQEGIARCTLLAAELRPYGPARIVASPEPKAHRTAVAVANALGGPGVRTFRGLREHDDMDVRFQSEPLFRAAVAAFFARPSEAVFGPETADEAYARFDATVAEAVQPDDGRSVVVVAHGRVISLFVARNNDLDPYVLWARLGLPSFVVLGLTDYRIEKIVDRV